MRSRVLALSMVVSLVACGGSGEAPAADESAPPAAGEGSSTGSGVGKSPDTKPGAPATTGEVKTDLFVRKFGSPSDPPVVFLHGGPGSSAYSFETTAAEALAARGNYVVTFDQRGGGRSPKGTAADYSFAKATKDVDDVIQSLHLVNPVLLGHSFGGALAVKFLDLHPGVARGAVIVSSPVDFPDSYANIHDRCIDLYRKTFAFGKVAEMQALHKRMFPKGLTPPYSFAGEDVAATMESAFDCLLYFSSSPTLDAAATWAKLLADPQSSLVTSVVPEVGAGYQANDQLGYVDLGPLYTKHKDRLYVVQGADDGLYSEKEKSRAAQLVGTSHYTRIAEAGHDSFIDRPDEIMLTIASRLGELRAK